MNHTKSYIALATLFATSCLHAQSTPVPTQLGTAKTVFIANAGGPLNYLNEEAYIDFYQALSAAKLFQIVALPANAELTMELSVTSHLSRTTLGTIPDAPFLQLAIRDVKTQSLLWSLTEPIGADTLATTSRKDIATAASDLVTDFKTLRSGTITSPLSDKK